MILGYIVVCAISGYISYLLVLNNNISEEEYSSRKITVYDSFDSDSDSDSE
tara:strand:- start:6393 stop:6545 length:153 start_codon:yes stop_codon:yes gene_type:complete